MLSAKITHKENALDLPLMANLGLLRLTTETVVYQGKYRAVMHVNDVTAITAETRRVLNFYQTLVIGVVIFAAGFFLLPMLLGYIGFYGYSSSRDISLFGPLVLDVLLILLWIFWKRDVLLVYAAGTPIVQITISSSYEVSVFMDAFLKVKIAYSQKQASMSSS